MGALKVSTAVNRVIRDGRAHADWSAAHELTAVLAVRLAKQLDAATGSADVVRLTREIRSLLGTLPGATPVPPDAEAGEDEPDAVDLELAAIVGARPEMGNAPHA